MSLTPKKDRSFDDNDFISWKKRWKERLKINNNSDEKFKELMRINNPIIIPRNFKVEQALNEANKDNLDPMNKLLEILKNPYIEKKNMTEYQMPNISKKKYQTFCGT